MNKQDKKLVEQYGAKPVHISDLRKGDTVIHNDMLKTVCRNDIKLDSFLGMCIFGDASKKYIQRVNI